MRIRMNRTRVMTAVGAAAILGVASLLAVASTRDSGAKAPLVSPEQLAVARNLSAAFERVADAVKPSVVNIKSVKRARLMGHSGSGRQMPPGGELREFFGDEFMRRFFVPNGPQGSQPVEGLGTGVIVSDDGYILTNNHVVNDADEVVVTLSDQRQFEAKVVGTDPKSDLAVLKIDASGLTPATLGDSDAVRPGEWVVAIGQPFGLSHTVTAGIVSAKGRANVGVADYEDFIQTDAAINPGNSGGPLVNLDGEVVGINTAIFSRSGGNMGIGFAIPSNMASSIKESLIRDGGVVRGWLGVVIQPLTKDLAGSFGYEGTDGVLVGDVSPDSPADKAGMQQGDIITRFNGKAMKSPSQLRSAVAMVRPDTRVKIEVFRDGDTKTLKATVGEQEAGMATMPGGESTLELGMSVRNLTAESAHELGLDLTQGVLITEVDPAGAAARSGLRAGDVIVRVQGRTVADVAAFRKAIKQHDLAKGVRLTVQTGEMQRFVLLRGDKAEK